MASFTFPTFSRIINKFSYQNYLLSLIQQKKKIHKWGNNNFQEGGGGMILKKMVNYVYTFEF